MDYDNLKLHETVPALLEAFEFENSEAWKRYKFSVMEALHELSLIIDPHGRSESVYLTEVDRLKAKKLASAYFGVKPKPWASAMFASQTRILKSQRPLWVQMEWTPPLLPR